MPKLAHVSDFCPNQACADYGKQQKNIVKYGKTKAGRQFYLYRTCSHTFTETNFYLCRTPTEEIMETLALLAKGSRVSSLSRVKGHKEDTILDWLRDAAKYAEACCPATASSAVNWTAFGHI